MTLHCVVVKRDLGERLARAVNVVLRDRVLNAGVEVLAFCVVANKAKPCTKIEISEALTACGLQVPAQ